MSSYYIYYRVAPDQRLRLVSAVGQMQVQIAAATGSQGKLMRKDDGSDTWMEIYQGVADPELFERVLREALAQAGFDRMLAPGSQRHIERFVDVVTEFGQPPASCA